jgi:hypothetical protein
MLENQNDFLITSLLTIRPDFFSFPQSLHGRQGFVQPVTGDNFTYIHLEGFSFVITVHPFRPEVPELEIAVKILYRYGIVGVMYDCGQ